MLSVRLVSVTDLPKWDDRSKKLNASPLINGYRTALSRNYILEATYASKMAKTREDICVAIISDNNCNYVLSAPANGGKTPRVRFFNACIEKDEDTTHHPQEFTAFVEPAYRSTLYYKPGCIV